MLKVKINNKLLLIAKILRRMRLKRFSIWYNTKRHNKIENEIVSICDNCYVRMKTDKERMNNVSNKVWVFWWQGENQMPELVKNCFDSLKTNLFDKKVILITKDNIKEYCTFPDYIFEKLESGAITLTHLSDILRFDLLSHYGGLYTDATIFWVGNISTSEFAELYTCGGYRDDYFFNVSKGRWTGFLIGGSNNNLLFTFMYNFFLEYWKNNDELIDYFLIDYALDYAYRNNVGAFKEYVDKNAIKNNPNLFKLMEIRNLPYTSVGKDKLLKDTCAFKLSYKKKFNDNKNTYGNQIVFGNIMGEN